VSYGLKSAVESLSLTLSSGASLGLVGRNGAGKTSTIKALLGMVRLRQGSINILGEKPGSTRAFAKMGFAPEDGVPPEYLSGTEYLDFVGSVRRTGNSASRDEIASLLDWFELPPRKKIGEFSKGMKRRVVLAQAFLGQPEFLILDEPLNGLDPLFILKLRQKTEEYLKAGGTLLLSSHILSEIEKACSEVAIVNDGKLMRHAPLKQLVEESGSVEAAFSQVVGRASDVATP